MSKVLEVNAGKLIEQTAKTLREEYKVEPPEWVPYVKTGVSRERSPDRADWYYVRMASILRKFYLRGNIGVGRLRTYYGGKKNRGVRPEHFYKGSGKVIRCCMQELEKKGLLKKAEKKGRVLTPKGQKFLNEQAKKVLQGGS